MRFTRLISGSSHPALAQSIADKLGISPSLVTLGSNCSSESTVELHVSVRNHDVFIVQSTVCLGGSVNDYLMQLLILAHACKYASAKRIVAVLPYFPYSKFSKKDSPRGSITAKLVADMLQVSGIHHVITMDLHAPPIQSFFDIPVDNLLAEPMIAKAICELSLSLVQRVRQLEQPVALAASCSCSSTQLASAVDIHELDSAQPGLASSSVAQLSAGSSSSSGCTKALNKTTDRLDPECSMLTEREIEYQLRSDIVIVAKTASSTKRVTSMSDRLNIDFAMIHHAGHFVDHHHHDHHHHQHGADDAAQRLVGNVDGKIAWILDDIIDDPTAYLRAARTVKKGGAAFVAIVAVHALLTPENLLKLDASPDIDLILFTNTIPLPILVLSKDQMPCSEEPASVSSTLYSTKIKVLDVSPILSEAIRRIHNGESISSLFYKYL